MDELKLITDNFFLTANDDISNNFGKGLPVGVGHWQHKEYLYEYSFNSLVSLQFFCDENRNEK